MNTYNPEANYGPGVLRRPPQLRVLGQLRAAVRARPDAWQRHLARCSTRILGGWRVSGIFQARSGLPDHGHRRPAPSLQGTRGNERPNCVGDPVPADQNIDHWLDINAFSARRRGTFGNCGVGVARAPGYKNIDAVLVEAVQRRRPALLRVPRRGVQPAQPSELRTARARHQRRRTRSALITSTVSTAADDRAGVQVLLLESEGRLPLGLPDTRARGDPCDPRAARVAHSLRSIAGLKGEETVCRLGRRVRRP